MAEEKKSVMGRPSIGQTKKLSITLPEEVWQRLDQLQQEQFCATRSELVRRILTIVSERGLE